MYTVKIDLDQQMDKQQVKNALDLIIKKHLNLAEVATEKPQQLVYSEIEEYE